MIPDEDVRQIVRALARATVLCEASEAELERVRLTLDAAIARYAASLDGAAAVPPPQEFLDSTAGVQTAKVSALGAVVQVQRAARAVASQSRHLTLLDTASQECRLALRNAGILTPGEF